MNLDPTIRDTLCSYADHAPTGAGLLGGARARARQRRRHRHLASAGLAAVTAAVAVAGWGLLPDRARDGTVVALPPGAPVTLVPAEYEVPAVPLSPGWAPEGAGEPYAGYNNRVAVPPHDRYNAGPVSAEPGFWLTHTRPDDGSPVILFQVVSQDVSHLFAGRGGDVTTEQVVVQGRPATLQTRVEPATSRTSVAVSWQHRQDMWVTVYGGDSGAEDVLRYAEALTDEPFPLAPPVTFEVLPADSELAYLDRGGMSFDLADGGRLGVQLGYDDGSGPVWGTSAASSAGPMDTPRVDPTTGMEIPTPQRLDIGGRPAELVGYADGAAMRIFYPDQQWVLSLYSTLSESDLRQVAEGIELTDDAQPQRTG
jgi:hypothetical protein